MATCLRPEVEHCTYNFEVADVDNLRTMYDFLRGRGQAGPRPRVGDAGARLYARFHLFNVLDARALWV